MSSISTEQKLIDALPIGACIFIGPELIIQAVNRHMLAIWNKDASVIGKSLYDAIPELRNQTVFEEQMNRVYETGESFNDPNGQADLLVDGCLQTAYFNYTFEPLYAEDGHIYGIMNTTINTTSQVLERKMRQEAEEKLSLAVQSANLGTWYIDSETREFIPSLRLKELFGYHPHEEMPYDAAVTQIADTHRSTVTAAVEAAITKGEAYDLEYPIIGFHDKKLRWVRATGKLYPGTEGKNSFFTGTIQDITVQKSEEQRKNDFIGIVSHELKTPLTSISGYIQVLDLKTQRNEDTAIRSIISRASRQIERMNAMISGFLDVARLGDSTIHLNRKVFNMADVVKQAEAESLATITTHQVIFRPVEYTPLHADPEKIEQVLVNFINNAVKYSPVGSKIHVACVTKGTIAYVSVQDQGMGIDPKDQPHIFERFYRVDNKQMTNIKGFGIGLYICKEIIERHGGQIGVESKPGNGSKFWFTLPIFSEE